MNNTRRLSELNRHIKDVLNSKTYLNSLWITSEVSELKKDARGNCYLELVDKDDATKKITAKVRATIWSTSFARISFKFKQVTKQDLKSGLQVLMNVSVEFHEVYGYSLNIKDINPEYTLGDLAKKRQEIIDRLTKEGLLNRNKALELPTVIQRLAVISSQNAAGYRDFNSQLENNQFNYSFSVTLFQAFVQGDSTEESILDAIKKIEYQKLRFDLIVIIRGGGSKTDLSYFDNYDIAKAIATSSLPVFTGIGHEQDDTVSDMVASEKLKTPTAVATFLIDRMNQFETSLLQKQEKIVRLTVRKINSETQRIQHISQLLSPLVVTKLRGKEKNLVKFRQDLVSIGNRMFATNKKRMNTLCNKVMFCTERSIRVKQLELDDWKVKSKFISNRVFYDNFRWLDMRYDRLNESIQMVLKREKYKLNLLEATNNLLDPTKILKRGYSITFNKSQVIKELKDIKEGDTIVSKVNKGIIESVVVKTINDGKRTDII